MSAKDLEIVIKNLRLRTIIGFNDWEREKPQDVVISIKLRYDAEKAIQGDDVTYAIDYKTITKAIIQNVEKAQFNLLESLANMIYEHVHSYRGVKTVEVTVEKPHCLRFSDNVIARITDNA